MARIPPGPPRRSPSTSHRSAPPPSKKTATKTPHKNPPPQKNPTTPLGKKATAAVDAVGNWAKDAFVRSTPPWGLPR